jgi:hypothetical protein
MSSSAKVAWSATTKAVTWLIVLLLGGMLVEVFLGASGSMVFEPRSFGSNLPHLVWTFWHRDQIAAEAAATAAAKEKAASDKAKADLEKCETAAQAVIAKKQLEYTTATAAWTSCEEKKEVWEGHGGPPIFCDNERLNMLRIKTRLDSAKRYTCTTASTKN